MGTSKASQMMEHHALHRCHFTKTSVALRTIAMFRSDKGSGRLTARLPRALSRASRQSRREALESLFELASHSSDRNLWVLALVTLAFASVRLIEAYGLWREREWAQWFSLLSTALYLPPSCTGCCAIPAGSSALCSSAT